MGEAFITRRGGKPPVPDIFGDGSDGDLVIAAGQTVVLPVTVPHQSVVEKQYRSVSIAAGGVLKCSDPNAGLVIRCKGNFTCHGTIDQSLMAPKTNPNNNYPYPAELVCGAGGGGVKGMPQRPYGGGYGAGGNGGGTEYNGGSTRYGGAGGSAAEITVNVENIFIGAPRNTDNGNGQAGQYGGGGGGGKTGSGGSGGNGGTGPGGAGGQGYTGNYGNGGGGGAGNYGGGVIMLYAQGTVQIAGNLLCTGGNGGAGGGAGSSAGGGQAGGGGGGGSIYILHNNEIHNTGVQNVNGGLGQAGTIGTVTIKRYEEGMTI